MGLAINRQFLCIEWTGRVPRPGKDRCKDREGSPDQCPVYGIVPEQSHTPAGQGSLNDAIPVVEGR